MSREDAQDKMVIQTDINVQSYLVQALIYEKMSNFDAASNILQAGKALLE